MKTMKVILLLVTALLLLASCSEDSTSVTICATPVITPDSGTYDVIQTVTITCTTEGATIRYTIDGSAPDTLSTIYTAPFEIAQTTTVKAIAIKTGLSNSAVATETIGIDFDDCVKPTINVASGTYYTAQNIVLETTTAGATIKYTLNNTAPDVNSTTYTGPFSLTHNAKLRVIAIKAGMDNSQEAVADYVIYHNLIQVAGGTFTMGRTLGGTGYDDELPTHLVTLDTFHIGKYEITQQEWIDVMGSNPATHTGDLSKPVEMVSFYDILVYCNKRSMNEGLIPVYLINNSTDPAVWGTIPTTNNATWNAAGMSPTGTGYRLPTEAEWEFAARGGAATPDYLYSGSNTIDGVAWYDGNAGGTTHAVGSKAANGKGLFDMTGNVREWTWDWYSATYYAVSPTNNPTGPSSPSPEIKHSIRGGSFDNQAPACRVAFRTWGDPQKGAPKVKNQSLGFRVVRK